MTYFIAVTMGMSTCLVYAFRGNFEELQERAQELIEIFSLIWVAEIIVNQRQRAIRRAACWIVRLSAVQRMIAGRKVFVSLYTLM